MNVAFFFRVKDVVNRDFSQKPLRAIKQKRKYFPKKVNLENTFQYVVTPAWWFIAIDKE